MLLLKAGITSALQNLFLILEMEERELLTRLDGKPYKMWILVLRKGGSAAGHGLSDTSIRRVG